jgi:hypothetical protein
VTFLDRDDTAILTGRKTRQGQIDQLRKMGLPFWVNASGWPVVPASCFMAAHDAAQKTWTPATR